MQLDMKKNESEYRTFEINESVLYSKFEFIYHIFACEAQSADDGKQTFGEDQRCRLRDGKFVSVLMTLRPNDASALSRRLKF